MLGCMIGVFLYGDPVVQSKSARAAKFWAHHKQADDYIAQVCHLLNEFVNGEIELVIVLMIFMIFRKISQRPI